MTWADLSPLANHLWQSTLCAAAAWALTLTLRTNRAAVRYWIWLAASVKFLVPFSLLVSAGGHFGLRPISTSEEPRFSIAVAEISRPFGLPVAAPRSPAVRPASDPVPAVLLGAWLCGFAVSVLSWLRWWRRIRAIQRQSTPLPLNLPIRVMRSATRLEPGVFGIYKPVLLLPEGITGHLPAAQFETLVAHELCHARRRDNLTGAIHMAVEAVFWFYPLVWWIGTRLVQERERACDQEVLRTGSDPQIYAEGILNVCRFYISAPLVCVSGVTGPDLTKRIEAIVSNRAVESLSAGRNFLLVVAATVVVVSPVIVGIATAPVGRARPQADSYPAAFEAASIKPAYIPIGREGGNRSRIAHTPNSLSMWNVGLTECVEWAYGVAPFQVSTARLRTDSYDILAKAEVPVPVSQLRIMLQALLAERFKLALHRETRMLPVYQLVVAKGGPKLPAANAAASHPPVHAAESLPRIQNDSFLFSDASLAEFARMLSQLNGIDLPVVDRTGITGTYDIVLKSAPGAAREADTAALFALIQDQLRLKLVSAKAPIEVVVIDRAEKPSEN